MDTTGIFTRERALADDMARHITHAGPLACFVEPPGNGLHQIFFLRVQNREWVGRKVLQRDCDLRYSLSSIVTPAMVFGLHRQSHWSNDGVSIFFQASTLEERAALLHAALSCPDSEIYFPFAVTDDQGFEAVCPPDFWEGDEPLAARLNAEEAHFREHCVSVLRTLLKPGDRVYDPACSTGAFIAHLAAELSHGHFLGTDRSASMIRFAQQHHSGSAAQFRLMDASTCVEAHIRCEVLILRFLNAEVMTRHEAHDAFANVVRCVEPGGTILVFGHTPVLLAMPWMAHSCGLTIVSSVAARNGREELFQFYRLTRPVA